MPGVALVGGLPQEVASMIPTETSMRMEDLSSEPAFSTVTDTVDQSTFDESTTIICQLGNLQYLFFMTDIENRENNHRRVIAGIEHFKSQGYTIFQG
jgi:hypothetical protein